MTNNTLKEFFSGQVEEINAVGEIDSSKVYNMEDYVELVKIDSQAQKNDIDLGNAVRVPDFDSQGNLTRTPRDKYVVNEDIAFINKIRVNKDDYTLTVVTDYRAIIEQAQGMIYTPSIVGYTIGKPDKRKNEYKVLKVEQVSEQDFINDFSNQLKVSDAKLMYEVITHHLNSNGTETGLELDSLFS